MGARLTVGALRVQTGITFSVVCTLLEVLVKTPSEVLAVTEDVSVPVVLPDTAVIVRGTEVFVAPVATTTELAPKVDVKSVVSLSLLVRLNVSLAHVPVSLFVIDKV
jgi:hypothetical protein